MQGIPSVLSGHKKGQAQHAGQHPLRAVQSFIFGGNTGMTYEQMRAAREFSQRQQQALARTPTNVGEGWGAILRGLVAGRAGRRADAAATEGREQLQAKASQLPALSSLFQNHLGGGVAMGYLPPQVPEPTQAGPVSGAFAGSAAASGQFPASLVQSESGGNWNALNDEGYGGRLQFGAARLADAARAGVIPAGMTGAQFSQLSPEQQQAVEQWHFADIDSQAQRMGLDRYIGQSVGGTPITQDSIRAMAHLGGIGGAAKFLQSGGQYNPSDSNGTSLADYARQHGGGGDVAFTSQMGDGQGIDPRLMEIMSDPYISELPQMQQGALAALFQQQLAQAYPEQMTPYQQATLQLEREKMGMKGENNVQPLMNAGGGQIYNPNTGEWISAPSGGQPDLPASAQALKWRAEQAGLKPGTPEYAQFMIEGGSKSGLAIDVDPSTNAVSVRQGVGAGASAKPFTEGQSKDNVYATRAEGALATLDPIAGNLPDRGAILAEKVPLGMARGMQSDDYQVARNAGDEFLQAILRKDTGAAITPQEQELYGKTYLPQPGDGPAVMTQKEQARRRAVEALKAGMSPAQMVAQERALQASGSPKLGPIEPPAPTVPAASQPSSVQPGHIEDGYRFKGGNPSDPSNWEQVQ